MFYKLESIPEDSLQKDFFLINNFLNKLPDAVKKIAEDFHDIADDDPEIIKVYGNIKDVIVSNFGFLINAERDIKIEEVTNTKEIYTKLANNGLTGDSLYVKLQMLDWLWYKTKDNPETLKSGLNDSFYSALINIIKSILSSILNALGFPSDIFNEALVLLNSYKEMSKEFKK